MIELVGNTRREMTKKNSIQFPLIHIERVSYLLSRYLFHNSLDIKE